MIALGAGTGKARTGANGRDVRLANGLAEREHEGLDARVGKDDLERPVGDRSALADQLVEPLLSDRPVALLVDVEAVRLSGRLAVDEHAERHRAASRARAHDEVDVASVEAERDPSVRAVEDTGTTCECPLAGERPLVEPERVRRCVRPRLVERGALR